MFYLFKRYFQNLPTISILLRAKVKVHTKAYRALYHVVHFTFKTSSPHICPFNSLDFKHTGPSCLLIHTMCYCSGPSSHSPFLECFMQNYSFASFPIFFKFFNSLRPTLTNSSPHLDPDLYFSTCARL